jgi:hypothetical protein
MSLEKLRMKQEGRMLNGWTGWSSKIRKCHERTIHITFNTLQQLYYITNKMADVYINSIV